MPRFPWSALTAAVLTGAAPAAGPGPRWTADGALIRPDSVDRWITVGTSLGLGYTDPTSAGAGRFQPLFHRVYLEPRAYQAARRNTTSSGSPASTSTDSRSAHDLRVMTRVSPSGPVRRMVLCSMPSPNITTLGA